jgi:hypothetical protein
MTVNRNNPFSDATSASARVGAAWRALGPHARAWHRATLATDIEALRQAVERADAAEVRRSWGRRMSARERQELRLLASTY